MEIRGLTKTFGRVRALDGLDLTVPTGQVAGFLGPNGAGKSTTIRVLLGLLRADGGTVRLLGGDPWADAVALHRRLAYVPGDVSAVAQPDRRRGDRPARPAARPGRPATRKAELLERFELDPTKKARTYSKGNRQKVALVAALAADVELLVLDEPTSGLDPLMEAVFTAVHRARPRRPAARSCCPATSSPRSRSSATRVTIIRAGRTVESGTLAELRHLTRTTVTAVTDARPGRAGRAARRARPRRPRTAGSASPSTTTTWTPSSGRSARLGVRSLVAAPPSLEELFLRHYGDELAEAGVR